jgi:HK97 family phage prohead protease
VRAVRFAGYAAIFDLPDRSGDIVRKGAFARAVAAGPGRVPLLWQHDAAKPIGRIERIAEDDRGLRVIGRLSRTSAAAREAAALLAEGAVGGLSFGYRVRNSAHGTNRELSDLDLVEVSLVTFPMQPKARVHAVAEECWIVGNAPTGDWAGHAEAIACYGSGGWRFLEPVPGMLAWSLPDSRWVWHDGNNWISGDWPVAGVSVAGVRILGPQRPAIASPTGGSTIDAEARTALAAVLVSLRAHGLIAS